MIPSAEALDVCFDVTGLGKGEMDDLEVYVTGIDPTRLLGAAPLPGDWSLQHSEVKITRLDEFDDAGKAPVDEGTGDADEENENTDEELEDDFPEESGKVMEEVDLLVDAISDIVKELQIKRCVIDSITSVCYRLKRDEKIRQFILHLGKSLSELGCTTMLVSEISPNAERYPLYGVEEAIADGIILLGNLERRGDLLRTLQVIKMRGTQHTRTKYVLDLTDVGVLLVPLLKGGGT